MKPGMLRFGLVAVSLAGVLALVLSARMQRADGAAEGVTHLRVTSKVMLRGVTRLGINLGEQDFYDSGQMLKNLISRNPGFEGMHYRSIFHCQTGGATRCIDTRQGIQFPAGFWDGASYEVLEGVAAGRKGSVRGASAGAGGFTIGLDGGKKPLGDGDWMALDKRFPEDPAAGWWPMVKGGAQLLAERADLPPGTPGQQALLMQAAGAGQVAQVNSYFDSTAGMTFVRLHGRYRLSFRAKAARPGSAMHIHVGRNVPGMRRYLDEDVRLGRSWANYSEEFDADESNLTPAAVEVGFSIEGGSALLDDVALEKAGGDATNRTVFRDEVVDTLRQLHPGVLRLMEGSAGVGSTVDNLLAPVLARQRSGFRTWFERVEDVPVGVPEFLELCSEVGADPWIVVPTAMSEDETRKLAEYLAGGAQTAGGAWRAGAGHPEPWTRSFGTIHIELGNETWNGSMRANRWKIRPRTAAGPMRCSRRFARRLARRQQDSIWWWARTSRIQAGTRPFWRRLRRRTRWPLLRI